MHILANCSCDSRTVLVDMACDLCSIPYTFFYFYIETQRWTVPEFACVLYCICWICVPYWNVTINFVITHRHFFVILRLHDDVIKWKQFPRYWPFVRGIHRSSVNSPHKGQWRGALMFSLICIWINDWVNNCEAGDLRPHRGHYDVIVMCELHVCIMMAFKFCKIKYTYDNLEEIIFIISSECFATNVIQGPGSLTHWGWEKMAAISQTTFSSAFSWMKMFEFRLKFHWSLFLRAQLSISQHWFR